MNAEAESFLQVRTWQPSASEDLALFFKKPHFVSEVAPMLENWSCTKVHKGDQLHQIQSATVLCHIKFHEETPVVALNDEW